MLMVTLEYTDLARVSPNRLSSALLAMVVKEGGEDGGQADRIEFREERNVIWWRGCGLRALEPAGHCCKLD